jgi:hypothetical protein
MAGIVETILGNPVIKIQEQSKSILDVFTKTVSDLEKVNKDVDTQVATREEIIKKAQSETELLNAVKTKNTAVIAKIARIFED